LSELKTEARAVKYSALAFYSRSKFLLISVLGLSGAGSACGPQHLAETLLLDDFLIVDWRGSFAATIGRVRSFNARQS
jgi:hypothetical protein